MNVGGMSRGLKLSLNMERFLQKEKGAREKNALEVEHVETQRKKYRYGCIIQNNHNFRP
jgi:hypothetical protein